MDPNDTDRKANDVSDTCIEPARKSKKDDIYVPENLACSISSAGQLAVAAINSPITAQSVTDMKVTASSALVSNVKCDTMKMKATSVGGMLIYSYSTYC